ncbi:MAG: hypothetical protein EOP56_05585 [Sphingobacteriales bacterium]|nr:MAG: hypothetical protein EOP56_05585 [Sphingobacteriales bacterium]
MRYLLILSFILLFEGISVPVLAAFPVAPQAPACIDIKEEKLVSAVTAPAACPEKVALGSASNTDGLTAFVFSMGSITMFLTAVATALPPLFAASVVMGALAVIFAMSARGKKYAGLAKAGAILGAIGAVGALVMATILLINP